MFKANVTYDKAALIGLMKYSILGSPSKLIAYIFITAFTGVLFLASIGSDVFVAFLIMFIIVVAVDAMVVLGYFVKPKIKLKNFTDDNIVINNFIFTNESILVSSKSKTRTGSSTIKYEWIIKACESKNAFYLFVNKQGGLIITKSEITEGNADQLRAFLCSKIPAQRNKLKKVKNK